MRLNMCAQLARLTIVAVSVRRSTDIGSSMRQMAVVFLLVFDFLIVVDVVLQSAH